MLAAQMATRAVDKGITYVAFTATPKSKTLELFGRRPRPNEPDGPANLPEPFHAYSMRQAIEEGFILDVLRNYMPYRLAFRLANNGKELGRMTFVVSSCTWPPVDGAFGCRQRALTVARGAGKRGRRRRAPIAVNGTVLRRTGSPGCLV
jgi:hypothetical protein